VVRITCPQGVADQFLAPTLIDLVKRYPGLRVQLDARSSVADLMRNEADLAIRTVRPTGGDLVMQRVAEARLVVVSSAERVKAVGVVKSCEALPWITWPDEMAMVPAARWLAKAAPGVAPVLSSNSLTAHLSAAGSGLGFAVVAEQFLLTNPKLTRVKLHASLLARVPLPAEELWLVGHRALREVPRVAATWDFLVERFRAPR
jgi:DNA-binding transcriptional LysR family regulator